jgi:hypothetical protein
MPVPTDKIIAKMKINISNSFLLITSTLKSEI